MNSARDGGDVRRERQVEYRRLQSQSIILEQDLRKKKRQHEGLVADIRRLKSDMARLDTELRSKREEEARVSRDLGILEAETLKTRKRLNLLA